MSGGSRFARWSTGGEALGVGAVTGIAAFVAYRAWRTQLRVPFSYTGDGFVIGSMVKGVADNGWWLYNPSLGAPFGQEQYDFAHGGETLQLAILRAMSFVTKDPGTLINLYYYVGVGVLATVRVRRAAQRFGCRGCSPQPSPSSTPSCPTTSSTTRRTCTDPPTSTRRWLSSSSCGRWTPRVTCCAPSPATPRTHLAGGTVRIDRGRVVKAVLLLVVIALTETMTTSFTMILLVGTGALLGLHTRDWRRFLLPAGAAAVLFAVFLTASAPTLLYHAREGSNEQAARRRPEESAIYGLRIARFVIPPDDHPIDRLAAYGEKNEEYPDGTEAGTWMGFLGLVAFLSALFVALTGRPDAPDRARRYLLGLIVTAATLVGAVEGFSKVAAVVGLSQVRTWNRISILIAFASLALLAFLVSRGHAGDGGPSRFEGWRSSWWSSSPWATSASTAIATATSTSTSEGSRVTRCWSTRSRRCFPGDASVFQLPVVGYPEDSNPTGSDVLRLYLHSDRLRWSSGGMDGRPEADWQDNFDPTDLERSVTGLLGMGFDGLTVHRIPIGGEDAMALEGWAPLGCWVSTRS